MMTVNPAAQPASQQAVVEAALLVLRQMGLSPTDLAAAPQERRAAPTFAEYVPVVSAAVTAGTRRAYGPYWNRIIGHWGERRLISANGNPARKVAKPRRLPSTRRAVAETGLAQINEVAATTGNDPELDTLLLPRSWRIGVTRTPARSLTAIRAASCADVRSL